MSAAISGNDGAASLPPPGSRFAHLGYEEIEGSGTPANAGSPTAASCDAARALLERARLSAFHRGSHLRELFHPKGSASGQASWDAVWTGVTRLRLSQSREAPPTPVIMPGDMMPKPPGSSLQSRPRAPPSLPCRDVPPRHVLQRSEDCEVTYTETRVNKKVTPPPASPLRLGMCREGDGAAGSGGRGGAAAAP